MSQQFSVDASLIANLNGFKREFAFLAAGIVLAVYGGGMSHTMDSAIRRLKGTEPEYG